MSSNGGSGSRERHSATNRSRASVAREATWSPAGPTPIVNGSHQSSNDGNPTVTSIRSATNVGAAGQAEQLCEVPLADPGALGLVVDRVAQAAHRRPEHRQRAALAGVVPDAGADHTAGTSDPSHLRQPDDRVGHEVDDELGERGVDRVVAVGQLLGHALLDLDAGHVLAGSGDEGRRRVDREDVGGAVATDQLLGEHAGPAAHVEDGARARELGPVGEHGRERDREPAHEPEVGVAVEEGHAADSRPPGLVVVVGPEAVGIGFDELRATLGTGRPVSSGPGACRTGASRAWIGARSPSLTCRSRNRRAETITLASTVPTVSL